MSYLLNCAKIEWKEEGPFSLDFNDIYFSKTESRQETLYTYIDGNQLRERWLSDSISPFILCELGFGTGLNALSTIEQWKKSIEKRRTKQSVSDNHCHEQSHLHYISIEKFPLTKQDFIKAQGFWPDLKEIAKDIVEQYPLPMSGVHSIELKKYNATITLLYDDVMDAMDYLHNNKLTVNAWFLDGFAPSKNESMWRDDLAQKIFSNTEPNGTFATFTAAGMPRRNFQKAGFSVSKRKGFGIKREMLIGINDLAPNNQKADEKIIEPSSTIRLPHKEKATHFKGKQTPPWFARQKSSSRPKTIAIIGAGISGCTTAHYLAEMGSQVTLFEKESSVAAQASGNSAGIYYPMISKDLNSQTQFYLKAFEELRHKRNQLKLDGCIHQCGVYKKITSENERQKLLSLTHLNPEISRILKIKESIESNQDIQSEFGWQHFETAGYVEPVKLCHGLIKHDNIQCRLNKAVTQITRNENQWQLKIETERGLHSIKSFDAVVFCAGFDSRHFISSEMLTGVSARGQTTEISPQYLSDFEVTSVICDKVYCVPTFNKSLLVGATFDVNNETREATQESQNQLDDELSLLSGKAIPQKRPKSGKVGFRFCAKDRLPFIGPVAGKAAFTQQYNALWKGLPQHRYPVAEFLPGLYVNTGHGARGITASFLSAKIIRDYIFSRPFAVSEAIRMSVHPSRELVRLFRSMRK